MNLKALLICCLMSGFCHAREGVDFSGTWHFGTMTPLERPEKYAEQSHFTEEQAREFVSGYDRAFREDLRRTEGDEFVGTDLWLDFGAGVEPDLRTSLIIEPSNGRLPARTQEAQRREDRALQRRKSYSDPEVLDISERCIADMVPILSGPDNNYLSILQNDKTLVVIREFLNSTRIVQFDDENAAPAHIQMWNGISKGHWEGNELVVKTSNFRVDSGMFGAGPNAVLTERFLLTTPDQIRYEFTIDDPAVFMDAWTARTYMHRSNKRRYEFACHEGNYLIMRGILLGTRIQENELATERPKLPH